MVDGSLSLSRIPRLAIASAAASSLASPYIFMYFTSPIIEL
jgi:hypothetical protein